MYTQIYIQDVCLCLRLIRTIILYDIHKERERERERERRYERMGGKFEFFRLSLDIAKYNNMYRIPL